jgi:hypothetical protein
MRKQILSIAVLILLCLPVAGGPAHSASDEASAKAANHHLVSLAFAGSSQGLIPELFVATSWSASSVTFEAQTLTSPPSLRTVSPTPLTKPVP